MKALLKKEIYTTEDIYHLPEGERAELIDGQIYSMVPPSTGHQRLVSEMHYQIKDYIKNKGGTCEVFPAPFAVFLDGDDSLAGGREYWVVDPQKKVVVVYGFEKEAMMEYAFGEDMPVEIYEGFTIRV